MRSVVQWLCRAATQHENSSGSLGFVVLQLLEAVASVRILRFKSFQEAAYGNLVRRCLQPLGTRDPAPPSFLYEYRRCPAMTG
jgi:hypothetical protein